MATGALLVNLLVEGYIDEVVMTRILQSVRLGVANVFGKQGRQYVVMNLRKHNEAAQVSPWLAVIDLDRDECAPALVKRLLPKRCEKMCVRVAVRCIEAWLMADAEALSQFLSVSPSCIPSDPEGLDDPKLSLVNLARRSRKRFIREDIVPRDGSGARVGPGYSSRIAEFAREHWRPEVAASRSGSLNRCMRALTSLGKAAW